VEPENQSSQVATVLYQAEIRCMYRVFTWYKRDEWERFLATVSDWDYQNYMDYLP